MVGGDEEVTRFRDAAVNDDYDVAAAPDATDDRNDPGHDLAPATCRATGRRPRAARQPRAARAGVSPSRIDRLDRQRQVSLRAGIAPGYAQADRIAALRAKPRKIEHAAGLHDRRRRARPRAGAHVQRVPLGVPAVGDLHVHDPGGAVREPRAPAHDPAVAAGRRAVRAAVAVG